MTRKETTDENDIIIRIAGRLRALATGRQAFSVTFEDEDDALMIPKGSTEKYLETGAQDAGLEITRKGSTQASLRQPSSWGVA